MTFLAPWTLLGLAGVAAVALWVLWHRRRKLAVVGSLRLWLEAVEARKTSPVSRTRKVNLAWLLLLMGAVCVVLAAGRPVIVSGKSVRYVSVVIHPSAELGPAGLERTREAVDVLLNRLGDDDRVELGGAGFAAVRGRWLSVQQARQRVASLKLLPVTAGEFVLPPSLSQSQHNYVFAVAGIDAIQGPRQSVISLPVSLPDVTLDALSARDAENGKTQVLIAVVNQRDVSQPISLETVSLNLQAVPVGSVQREISLDAGSRSVTVFTLPAATAYEVIIRRQKQELSRAFLVRRESRDCRIALVGRDDPYLRKLLSVDPSMHLVIDSDDADVVIANQAEAPRGKPSLLIAPARPPQGYVPAREEYQTLMLQQADLASDDPILRGVDLSDVAVRRVRPWQAGQLTQAKTLVGWKGKALITRDTQTGRDEPRCVCIAFDISEENSTLVRSHAYVVLLANILRYLSPEGTRNTMYESETPSAVVDSAGMWVVRAGKDDWGDGMIGPGLYRRGDGELCAINLVGLEGDAQPQDPLTEARAISLPATSTQRDVKELWVLFLVLGLVLWLMGWCIRCR